ncbi:MAG: serine protease [Patescibacteria group bacterium]
MFEKILSLITGLFISLATLFQGPTKPVVPPVNPPPARPAPNTRASSPAAARTPPPLPPAPEPVQPNPKSPEQAPTPKREPEKALTAHEVPKSIEARPIDLRSVVGLTCYFENTVDGSKTRYRGSGVIIREGTYQKGTYILTNRHVVDLLWTSKLPGGEGTEPNMKLKECEVRIFTAERTILPEEVYPYPYYDLQIVSGLQHDFKARLAYLPATKELSSIEDRDLDYAILEVFGKNESKYFAHENPRLPPASILLPSPEEWVDIITGSRIVMPGYAFQQTGSGSFDEFRLLTKDGVVKDIYAGDTTLKDVPMTILVEVPPDAYGGRSGSPIFYKGYLIGLVATKALPAPNSKDYQSAQPAITGIMENMESQTDTREIFENIFSFE